MAGSEAAKVDRASESFQGHLLRSTTSARLPADCPCKIHERLSRTNRLGDVGHTDDGYRGVDRRAGTFVCTAQPPLHELDMHLMARHDECNAPVRRSGWVRPDERTPWLTSGSMPARATIAVIIAAVDRAGAPGLQTSHRPEAIAPGCLRVGGRALVAC